MNKITKGYPNWDIPLNNNIQEYNDTMGTEEMGTTSTTVKGAIKELKKSIDSNKTELSDKVQINTADISNLKTKNTEITTQLNANTQDINNNENNISNHINNLVTNTDGVHGLKVEYGEFNPNLYGSIGGEATISNKIAYYSRFGNLVNISMYIEISAKNTASGYTIIGGLPYKSKINSPLEITYGGINLTTESKIISAETLTNTINLFNLNNVDDNKIYCDDLTNLTWIHINGSYIIDLN